MSHIKFNLAQQCQNCIKVVGNLELLCKRIFNGNLKVFKLEKELLDLLESVNFEFELFICLVMVGEAYYIVIIFRTFSPPVVYESENLRSRYYNKNKIHR